MASTSNGTVNQATCDRMPVANAESPLAAINPALLVAERVSA